MAFQEAEPLLSTVASFARSLLPELEGNSRNLRIAQDVSEVFDLYASHIRTTSVAESEQSNTQRNRIRAITKSAKEALKALEHFHDGASKALDRAYANGETIEKIWDTLGSSLNAASAVHHPNTVLTAAGKHFHSVFNSPVLPPEIHLDFDSMDENGQFLTPEGKLRHCVFLSMATNIVTVARGAKSPTHPVSCMGGVGKTTALIGLGHDSEIRARFVDGVIFFSLGAAVSEESVTQKLVKVMDLTGGRSKAFEVKSASSLSDAVACAATWFLGKRLLLLVDDLWPTPGRPQGYFPELAGLLRSSPDSRIALSTRSVDVAIENGFHVDFLPRDRQGRVAVAIFLKHARPNTMFGEKHVRRILSLCAGFPIVIAMAGATVALQVNTGLPFGTACETYYGLLSDAMLCGVPLLDAVVSLSLDALEHCASQNWNLNTAFTFRQLYCSLRVLQSQQRTQVSALGRMWMVNEATAMNVCRRFSSMCLVQLSSDEATLSIHDLQLDYARRTAASTSVLWRQECANADRRFRLEVYTEVLQNQAVAVHREGEEMWVQLVQAQAENAELRALAVRNVNPAVLADPRRALSVSRRVRPRPEC